LFDETAGSKYVHASKAIITTAHKGVVVGAEAGQDVTLKKCQLKSKDKILGLYWLLSG